MWPYIYCHYWLGIIRLDFICYVSLLLVNMPSGTSWSSQSCPRCSLITQILPAEEGPGDTELLASDLGPARKSFCSCGCETLSLRREGKNSVGSTFWPSHQSPHSSVYCIPLVGGGHFLFLFFFYFSLGCDPSYQPILLCQCIQINSVGNFDGKLDELARETSDGKLKVVILREEKIKWQFWWFQAQGIG